MQVPEDHRREGARGWICPFVAPADQDLRAYNGGEIK